MLYLFYYTECPISTTYFTTVRHCRVTFKLVTRPIDQSDLLEINMRYNNIICTLSSNADVDDGWFCYCLTGFLEAADRHSCVAGNIIICTLSSNADVDDGWFCSCLTGFVEAADRHSCQPGNIITCSLSSNADVDDGWFCYCLTGFDEAADWHSCEAGNVYPYTEMNLEGTFMIRCYLSDCSLVCFTSSQHFFMQYNTTQ